MKTPLLLAILSLFSVSIASARIGETEAEITKRYGEGKKSKDSRLPGTTRYAYVKNGFDIEVMFLSGKSVMEVMHRQDKEITDEDIKAILKANGDGDGHGWSKDRKTGDWVRGDRKLRAFRAPGHPDFLFVQDVAVVKETEKSGKAAKGGF